MIKSYKIFSKKKKIIENLLAQINWYDWKEKMLSIGPNRSREVLCENGCCFWWKWYAKISRIINKKSIAESDSISSIGSKLMGQKNPIPYQQRRTQGGQEGAFAPPAPWKKILEVGILWTILCTLPKQKKDSHFNTCTNP